MFCTQGQSGDGTCEEMCVAFLAYYPQINAGIIHESLMRCMTYNDIHDLPDRVVTHKVLGECLGLDSSLDCLLLLNFWPHILASLPTINTSS